MLAEERYKQLLDLVNFSTKEELIWINGYLSGLVSNGFSKPGTEPSSTTVQPSIVHHHSRITVLYGTETGNSKKVATQLTTALRKKNLPVKLQATEQYRLSDLAQEETLIIVISTQGEGEPPATAKKFYDHVHQATLKLGNVKYAVLGLGDTSYPLYCQAALDIDKKIQEAGATALLPLAKCDVDYEEYADPWISSLVDQLAKQEPQPVKQEIKVEPRTQARKHYEGSIITNINLNDRGSNKETFHIEIAATEDVDYVVGDAMAIIPVNKKIIVDFIFKLTGADRTQFLETTKSKGSLEELLTHHLNICYLTSAAVQKYAGISGHSIPDVRMDLVDLLRIYPLKDVATFIEIVKILSPIAPRLYSISSSPAAHGRQELHLTVSRHSFRVKEEQRYGLCSDFLGELPIGTSVKFYIHKSRSFRLPDPGKPIIMIGPGTGIAPFRAFLAEREATGANGKNWFFFGEQHFVSDFLYQAELQQFVDTGVLNKISLAFSRDQAEKIYVQHRMKEQAAELFQWIQDGAFVYISGTRNPMSKDVEHAILDIISEQGNMPIEQAKQYLHDLKEQGRYEKDVY